MITLVVVIEHRKGPVVIVIIMEVGMQHLLQLLVILNPPLLHVEDERHRLRMTYATASGQPTEVKVRDLVSLAFQQVLKKGEEEWEEVAATLFPLL